MKILVIADDLTGGLDTGVQFAARGIPAKVIVNGQHWEKDVDRSVQALILDAETRCMDGKEAYKIVRAVVCEACKDRVDYIYKKTDSAQRGNIGYELQAVLDGAEQSILHYAPAFPQMGRTTRGGIHYVNDVPVADTVFGQDPYEPVKHSYIPDIIHEQSDIEVKIQNVDEGYSKTGKEIRLYDASSQEELNSIAETIIRHRTEKQVTLLAGCAGFASALSSVLGTETRLEFYTKKRFLVVIGSMNPITGRQLEHAVKNGFVRIRLKKEQLQRQYWETAEGYRVLEIWKEIYEENSKIILDTNDDSVNKGVMDGVREEDKNCIRSNVTESLGMVVCALLKDMSQTTLMVVGGDTLTGLMQQMNVQELVPICETLKGVVCSEFVKDGRTVRMLSKSGGFGEADLLTKLADILL